MDDKDFLSYFRDLGSQKVDVIKKASTNIMTTLLAID